MVILMAHTIRVIGKDATVRFAATELKRYLRKATGKAITAADSAAATFTIGLCEALGMKAPRGLTAIDDWVRVKESDSGYILTGANPRSVLFAVYRYLEACGCRWLRPGRNGEIIPKLRSPRIRGIDIDEQPDHPYRSICIEGSCSVEHVTGMIDWLTKKGMNGYFIQFHHGSHFFERWYTHAANPEFEKEPYDIATITRQIVGEITKRGLVFERMGHGWTCIPFGLPGEGWVKETPKLTPAQTRLLAKVNGKRELHEGVALNTNLCYSNPTVRRTMAKSVVGYVRENPEVDVVHLWLADGSNNNCECSNCRKMRLSDWYVELLNDVDTALDKAGMDTRIVFLIYVDLLWPPQKRRIKNQGRFILMFAPITRSYASAFAQAAGTDMKIKPYRRNKLQFPKSAAENVAYMREWSKVFDGDGFDFDYHAIWACYSDLAQVTISRTLYDDIRGLNDIGLHGLNSCQVQRQCFPHSLMMNVLAETLWNKKRSFKSIVDHTFSDAFGRSSAKVATFFVEMSRLAKPFFECVYIPKLDTRRQAASLRNIPKMQAAVAAVEPLAKRQVTTQAGTVRQSWKYLVYYLKIMKLLLPAYEAYLQAAPDIKEKFDIVFDYLHRHESILHPVLDVDMVSRVIGWRIFEAQRVATNSEE